MPAWFRYGLVAVAIGVVMALPLLLKAPPLPYVVTAIDYHFHDAHPTAPIGPDTDLVVNNVGANVHNVTFTGKDFSVDIPPGGRLEIPDISGFLGGPGRYSFYCKYHEFQGMTGTIVIEDATRPINLRPIIPADEHASSG